MWSVVGALVPAGCWGVYVFGVQALFVIAASVLSAVASEALIQTCTKRKRTISDGSAVLTGLLLAYNLPAGVPLWIPVIGSVFAIAIGKLVFGGLGHNIFNPALAGRAFLLASWPVYMTTWKSPRWVVDAVTSATPLGILKEEGFASVAGISKIDLLFGVRGGCIGELSAALLLGGAAYLFIRGYISWHIPLTYITTVGVMSWIFNGPEGFCTGDTLFFVLTGGLFLGALFMATDYVTSPMTSKGKLVFAFGCGLLTFIIRRFCGYPEGVSYSILIMNAMTPMIDRLTFPKWFGWAAKSKAQGA